MGIVVRQSLKAGLGSYIGVGIGIVNQMYVSTKFLSVEQYALSRLLFENSLLFSAFAHLGTPFIADKFFSLFRDDENQHRGILPFLLFLPFIGGLLFSILYLLFTPAIHAYYAKESPMLLKYHFLVIPLTIFWIYITVLEAYCRNNARIAVPSFIREVYLKLANVILIFTFGMGWLSFDMMLYLVIASYGLGVLILISYIKTLGKWYWRFPDRNILTGVTIRQMLAYGGFTLLGGIGVNLMLFIDRTMLAGERGLVNAGIFIIASYIAGVIEIPRKAIGQISIPLLSTSLTNGDYDHVRTMNQKSALNQLIAGGLFFLLIWASIDDIFYLIPKGDTYGEGKYVVLFLALAKVFDIATGLNTEIILYSKFFRFATLFIVASAICGFLLNLWLIPLYGFLGAAIATALTTFGYSMARMLFVGRKFGVLPFTGKTVQVAIVLALLYALTFLVPDYTRTVFSAMTVLVLRSGVLVILFAVFIIRMQVSVEINELVLSFQRKWLK
ncbi:oligosaccharide flippase family protein [Dyadobacter diqingensis]|uniref:oligosaccharide flippase family protein n=1 Tax=Dyadobacter diqingensis TaxID=2938121 RepID=UPI0020C2A9B1|nr:polysaccharide biosynthesis C-terminal domain-containing protein [Dyadobacter diqingensis]